MKNYIISMKYPAKFMGELWRDAMPTGNGEIGTAIYGAVNKERILINHEDLFWLEDISNFPDISDTIPEVRKLLLENRAVEADKVMVNALKERKGVMKKAIPLPLGDILINMETKKPFKKYLRTLELSTGEVVVSWLDGETNFKRRTFVSRHDNSIYVKIEKNGDYNINGSIGLDIHNIQDATQEDRKNLKLDSKEITSQNNYVYYKMDNDNNTQFGAVMKVFTKGGSASCENGKIVLNEVEELTAIIKVFVDSSAEKEFPILEKAILNNDYETALQKHIAIHKDLFERSSIDLGANVLNTSNEEMLLDAYDGEASCELIEKMWAFGRFMLIACTNKKGNPFPMYGLWSGKYNPKFSFIMCNENIQMIYWQALAGNFPELLLSLFELLERQMDDYRKNARLTYGCRGINVSAPITPRSGLCTSLQPHILHWTGGAGWLSQHYFDYYLYTGDKEFLAKRAIPFMYETALFYEDYLLLDENNKYMFIPSNSPENTPKNFETDTRFEKNMETTINATMDFAILKELLTNLISACKLTGLHLDEVAKWEDMLKLIPEYQINDDGAIKEWMHPFFEDNYKHRHESHIYPAFPGSEITKESNEKMYNACLTALHKRRDVGLAEQSGWSLAHMSNAFARLECANESYECLEVLLRTCVNSNLYTFHNDWRNMGAALSEPLDTPVQLDANMGFVSAIQEMLIFSTNDTIKILPALPDKFMVGSFNSFLAKGKIEVSANWNLTQKTVSAKFISETYCKRFIKVPIKINEVKTNSNYKIIKENIIELDLKQNEDVTLTIC